MALGLRTAAPPRVGVFGGAAVVEPCPIRSGYRRGGAGSDGASEQSPERRLRTVPVRTTTAHAQFGVGKGCSCFEEPDTALAPWAGRFAERDRDDVVTADGLDEAGPLSMRARRFLVSDRVLASVDTAEDPGDELVLLADHRLNSMSATGRWAARGVGACWRRRLDAAPPTAGVLGQSTPKGDTAEQARAGQ